MKNIVQLDYGFCMADILGSTSGLSEEELNGLAQETARVHKYLEAEKAAGRLGFWQLPALNDDDLAPVYAEADKLKDRADNLVVLGIGGSALGTTAVDMALRGKDRLALPGADNGMKVWVADNSDPRSFATLLDNLPVERTAFNVVSKSGSTSETMSQFLVVLERLERILGPAEAKQRIIFTTDPQDGVLRLLAAKEGYTCLDVPSNVGGRFSVLSAVGLFPLLCAGLDIKNLLAGAGVMAERVSAPALTDNPAYVFAALAVWAMRRGRNILVMMPYVTDLFGLAQWFAQLWGESLGKASDLEGKVVNVGQTPVAAAGATDQHSQLQLYMEGPHDKLICFLTLDNYGTDLEIPNRYPDIPSLSYLGGHSMAELIQAEAMATSTALAAQGRPNFTLKLPRLNEQVIGQLLFLLEAATVAAGALLNVNPLDQPGVELGKKLTYGLMGREGFAEFKEQANKYKSGGRFVL